MYTQGQIALRLQTVFNFAINCYEFFFTFINIYYLLLYHIFIIINLIFEFLTWTIVSILIL